MMPIGYEGLRRLMRAPLQETTMQLQIRSTLSEITTETPVSFAVDADLLSPAAASMTASGAGIITQPSPRSAIMMGTVSSSTPSTTSETIPEPDILGVRTSAIPEPSSAPASTVEPHLLAGVSLASAISSAIRIPQTILEHILTRSDCILRRPSRATLDIDNFTLAIIGVIITIVFAVIGYVLAERSFRQDKVSLGLSILSYCTSIGDVAKAFCENADSADTLSDLAKLSGGLVKRDTTMYPAVTFSFIGTTNLLFTLDMRILCLGAACAAFSFCRRYSSIRKRTSRRTAMEESSYGNSRHFVMEMMEITPTTMVGSLSLPLRIKKAVLIGIKYRDLLAPWLQLERSHSDVDRVYKLLLENGFETQNITILRDREFVADGLYPTRDNIINSMKWLVQGATSNHTLFFYYAGHGKQIHDIEADESDSAIVPAESGVRATLLEQPFPSGLRQRIKRGATPDNTLEGPVILDDEMRRFLCANLPAGCRLRAVFDMCHSGTALDLDHVFTAATLRQAQPSWFGLSSWCRNAWRLSHGSSPTEHQHSETALPSNSRPIGGILRPRDGSSGNLNLSTINVQHSIEADVVSLGACGDNQGCYDDSSLAEILQHVHEKHGGASIWRKVLNHIRYGKDERRIASTWRKLLYYISDELGEPEQTPTLSSSLPLDWDADLHFLD